MELLKYYNVEPNHKFEFEPTESTLKIQQLKKRIDLAQLTDTDLIDTIQELNLQLENLKVQQVLNPSDGNIESMKLISNEIGKLNQQLQNKKESVEVIPVLKKAIEELQNFERKECCKVIAEKLKEIQVIHNTKIEQVVECMKKYNELVTDLLSEENAIMSLTQGNVDTGGKAQGLSAATYISKGLNSFRIADKIGTDIIDIIERKQYIATLIKNLDTISKNDDFVVYEFGNNKFKIVKRSFFVDNVGTSIAYDKFATD